jgi:recombinational DNA repair protein (RecF pathway)
LNINFYGDVMSKCALCGTTESSMYVATTRAKGKVVCSECINDLWTRQNEFTRGVAKVGKALQKGAQAFKEEFGKQE